ncbi:MAG: PqqD family protein [archaeon]
MQKRNHWIGKASNLECKRVDDEMMILQCDEGKFYRLNLLGTFIWDCISKRLTKAETMKRVMSRFDVKKETAENDLEKFTSDLIRMKLLILPKSKQSKKIART